MPIMRKFFITLLSITMLCIFACSKDVENKNIPIGLYPEVLVGKWSFQSFNDITVLADAHDLSPFVDTLIFTKLGAYTFIDNNDTSDRGKYTLGESRAMNEMGEMQVYDSILLKTDYITQSATTPSVYYFKIADDTLTVSNGYYNDPFLTKKVIKYIKK